MTHATTALALKRRSPFAVFLLPIITLGIYQLVWYAKTRGELKESGASIPTTWCIIVPILGFVWLYWLAAAIKTVTGKQSSVGTFVLLLLLGSIGNAIVQSGINKTLPR
jgi:hypothetical protein